MPSFLCSMPKHAHNMRAEGAAGVQGTHESLEEAARREAMRKETPQQAAARLQAESKQVRSAVRCMRCQDTSSDQLLHVLSLTGGKHARRDALQSGLKRKAAEEPEAAQESGRPKKGGMLADVLGDLSGESDDEE